MQAQSVEAKLRKAEEDLAELIDEIVVQEGFVAAAEERSAVLEHCLQNALGYVANVEQQVLIPAFSDLAKGLKDEQKRKRNDMMASGERIPDLDNRTAALLNRIAEPSEAVLRQYFNERDSILNKNTNTVDLETAFVECELLLRSKEELKALLADAKSQAASLQKPSGGGASSEELAKAKEETQHVRDKLDKVMRERDQLIVKLNEEKPVSALQSQHLAEKEALQKKVRSLENAQQQIMDERFALRERFETLQRALDQAYQEKAMVSEELARVSRAPETNLNLQQSEEVHQLRLKLDQVTREHSTQVTKLEGDIANLRMELANSRTTTANNDRETVQSLQRANNQLRNDLAALQQRLLSSSSSEGNMDTKIQAFEMTISALNSELAMVEGKIASVEKHYVEERSRIIRNFDDERRRFQQEREECDQLVLRMTNELENLVRENGMLKERLQM